MFLSQRNIFVSSPLWIFISSPVGFVISLVDFLISPVENFLLGLTLEHFLKIWRFPWWVKQCSPGYGTETGCPFAESFWTSKFMADSSSFENWEIQELCFTGESPKNSSFKPNTDCSISLTLVNSFHLSFNLADLRLQRSVFLKHFERIFLMISHFF